MSIKYDNYLLNHISNVQKGYKWLKQNLPDLLTSANIYILDNQIEAHDNSKFTKAEYDAYANYFYGENKNLNPDKVKSDFDYAWLHHQKKNPHHWQYWILVNDTDGTYCLDMPYEYVIEMFCDWWAFSWSKNNLNEIFSWYDNNKSTIQLSDKSRKDIESILQKVKEVLENE